MPSFFIDRPVFAWIVALAIVVAGMLAIPQLPVAQYPRLAPPRIVISATYPGASTETVDGDVGSIIEESLDGADGLLYYETSSDGHGNLEIDVTFATGADPDLALVDVQNRLKQIEPRLPQQVVQQGIGVFKATNTFLMLVALTSTDGTRDSAQLSDYLSRYVLRELKRAPGVGSAQLWDADEALRIWLDPMKLREYGLGADDVIAAVAAQNAAVTAGAIGDAPFAAGQQLSASVIVKGQLASPAEFGQIVLKSKPDGSVVRLADVARVELGRDDYSFSSRLNGQAAATVGIQLGPRGNALETSNAIRARLAELSKRLPPGVAVDIPFDGAHFVRIAIDEVVLTLVEAIVLVFGVMWLFLRDLRCTLVPTIVIPVTLMGAFVAMWAFGLSINVFTMFGLVLAIGILVDDAIVVVESVHRVMEEERVSPREATRRAMKRIVGAIVGVTAVLTAVFVPMAFFPGGVGGIYRQFAVAMIASMLVSSFMALSLTPALCANLLKPLPPGGAPARIGRRGVRGLGAWAADRFAAGFARASTGYRSLTARTAARIGPMLAIYAVLLAFGALMYWAMPDGFLPTEDQGQLQVMIQLPAGATQARTMAVVERVEAILHGQPAVANVTSVIGWSFAGSGQNVAMAFVELKDWAKRGVDAAALRDRLNGAFARIRDGDVDASLPPAVPGIGHSDGFTFRLEDRGGVGIAALKAARERLADAAKADPALASVRTEDLPDAPRIELDIDRAKAYAFGVPFERIAGLLGGLFGSNYVDDFPAAGRMRRVIVEADAGARSTDDQLMTLTVPNKTGDMVPLSAIASRRWSVGPVALNRYDGYPSLDVNGRPAGGHSLGAAMAEMERLAASLPTGIGYDWVDAAREETVAAKQTPLLIGLSVLAVFMALAALYESWTIPLSVLTVVPLGVIGAVAAVQLRGMPNDVYFKVGMITVIGLSAKNAILIVQFARDLHARGAALRQAVIDAASARFRPIVMTSMAFVLGVVPLVTATGAGAESRRSIGTGAFGGVLAATLFGLVFAPIAFQVVASLGRRGRRAVERGREPSEHGVAANE
ncbi:multidrug efflux RND transporter permease subunit [Burkholderia oklahomensis]|uniref:multidrug efflux RND transporter permease subunit n=2 Tax=Burkholderia oklahomensis TaxID=342113 RepID=UPI0005D95E7D|nr:multidrug efflux RND transporter permease subunit [Burkholderia oklahomensis]AJX34351.1 RND transporter, hydrophobe/amphiphile efflux-1 family protein [Burkholderia oklahomensis C6786]AOI50037.1 acriflavine resistance protein B [Burkholderia oklahomensis C6786]KUY53048.1 acriflavine resistance protein B [Burkholderia oklahomensis C6786]MBI0364083.1 multidrug efflux RND transporter permease subunit [Burkholderia oklahomensis]SUY28400.1 Acriflavine resistance protein B [Burkholderia oklahomen